MFANLINSMNKRATDEANSTRIITLYNSIPEEYAERVMRFWQIRASTLSNAANLEGADESDETIGMNTLARAESGLN